jgi:hypothetical protein
MERIARRAPGSADMRAALAALYYDKGLRERAEDEWNFACDMLVVREFKRLRERHCTDTCIMLKTMLPTFAGGM